MDYASFFGATVDNTLITSEQLLELFLKNSRDPFLSDGS